MKSLRRFLGAVLLPIALAGAAAAPSPPALFSSDEPIAFQLKAPFTDLIDNGREIEDYGVVGTLVPGTEPGLGTPIENVKISLRGHTSLRESECSFPKLKLHFNQPPQDGPFALDQGRDALRRSRGQHADRAIRPPAE